MSIRSKLAWTFILLLIFGITAISSYSILFIRNYLLQEGEHQIVNDTRWLGITIQHLPSDDRFETRLNEAALISGYRIDVFDAEGHLFASVPYDLEVAVEAEFDMQIIGELSGPGGVLLDNRPESDRLVAYTFLLQDGGERYYLKVSQLKEQIYEPIRTIRWIIYTGMFISIGLVILVSVLFARYISRPILQLESTARAIAKGDVDRKLHLDRRDEFGTLADSLNRMASRLRRDNRELQRLYEKQAQFFADITHELRNPLHTVSGSLEMLQIEDLDEKQRRHYLQTAVRQTDRIHRLWRDLATLQRYDSDTDFIEKKEFHLSPLLVQIYELYYPQALEKGIRLELDTGSFSVFADPGKIEQVLDNLVSNALKYTGKGEIRISCREEGDGVRVAVSDTGIGISEEHLSRLFDRFYRTDKARSRDKGGTGLGLAVVRSILEAHGTSVDVESRPGQGSVFSFTLPRADAPQASESG